MRPIRQTTTILLFAALSAALLLAAAPATHADSGNVNFVGQWNATTGGWTILTQDPATGACTGTSDFSGYTLTDCTVTGSSYAFTVNLGTDYHSYNSGTISGNSITGSFHDTNGTQESYTAVRLAAPTVTSVTASPAATRAGHAITFHVRVTSQAGAVAGSVLVKAGKHTLCTAKVKAGVGSCHSKLAPVGTHETITASYRGGTSFASSAARVRITVRAR